MGGATFVFAVSGDAPGRNHHQMRNITMRRSTISAIKIAILLVLYLPCSWRIVL